MADPRLVKYLKEQAAAGFGKEQIYQALLNAGWSKEEINEAIYEMMGKSPKKPPQTAQKPQPDQKAGPETPGIFWKLKNVLFHPGRFFEAVKPETGIKNAFIFMLVVSLANILIMAAILLFAGSVVAALLGGSILAAVPFANIITLGVVYLFGVYALSIGLFFLLSEITHGFVRIAGGKRGFSQTFKGVAYAAAPGIFLLVIYPVSFLGGGDISVSMALGAFQLFVALWSLYLAIRGVSAFQEISAGKAFTVIVFTSIVVIVAVFVISSFLVSLFLMSYMAPLF